MTLNPIKKDELFIIKVPSSFPKLTGFCFRYLSNGKITTVKSPSKSFLVC